MALQQDLDLRTETERANRMFKEEVARLPGIVRVETLGGETIGEQWFQVYIRPGDLQAEYSVYDLRGKVYDCYPTARLAESWVIEEADAGHKDHDVQAMDS